MWRRWIQRVLHLPEQFRLRLSIQLKGFQRGMGVGSEGGKSLRVKFGIRGRVWHGKGLVFVILNMFVMLCCWVEVFVSVLSQSQVWTSKQTVWCSVPTQGCVWVCCLLLDAYPFKLFMVLHLSTSGIASSGPVLLLYLNPVLGKKWGLRKHFCTGVLWSSQEFQAVGFCLAD